MRNVLLSREPIYGLGKWAEQFAPDLLGLTPRQLGQLNDDGVGRSLDRWFDATTPQLLMDVVFRSQPKHVSADISLIYQTLELAFLPEGKFRLKASEDGSNTDRNAEEFQVREMRVSSASTENIRMSQGGGWVAIIDHPLR